MTISDVAPGKAPQDRASRAGALLGVMLRYGVTAAGPMAVSAAHFLASLIFLRTLPAHAFGLFSFVMVVVSFGMSLNVSLISVPITRHLVTGGTETRPICFQANWLVCAGFALLLFAALWVSGAALPAAAILALYGGLFVWRWFARCFALVEGRTAAAVASDLTYSLLLVASLALTAGTGRLDFLAGSAMLLLSASAALAPFGAAFFRTQFAALLRGAPKDYWPIFRDLTRWSLMGVVLTEVTANAHAYLVTFIAGPSSFALLALGMLLMRPASLMQSALPDLERPVMARAIAAGDIAGLSRIQHRFLLGLTAALLGTLAVCAVLLAFFPALVLKKGYGLHDVMLVTAISAVITAVRALRVPPSVVLQAAGQFRELAGIGTWSGAVSVGATLALLLAFGPVASLGGILLGELVILAWVTHMARAWKAAHA